MYCWPFFIYIFSFFFQQTLNISHNTCLRVMKSFSFFLSGKLFTCPLILKEIFAWQSNLGCRSFLFITQNIQSLSLLACKVSVEKIAGSPMGTPLWIINCFSLVAFMILFVFNLWHFNCDVFQCRLLQVYLGWNSLHFMDLCVYFLHQVRVKEIIFIIFSNMFFQMMFSLPHHANIDSA